VHEPPAHPDDAGRSEAAPAHKNGGDKFAMPGKQSTEYTDGRQPAEWRTNYPPEARKCINQEACFLALLMLLLCAIVGALLGLSGQTIVWPIEFLTKVPDTAAPSFKIEVRLLTIFFVGCLGGTTFSVKWLIHSAAKSKWHLDRRYWRFFVPLIGGVYACVVLTLFDSGLIGSHGGQAREMGMTAAYAFLVGYFSDGVSGLLSNIANAVFGTLEKK
jgi:hypothetical protein